MYIHILGISCKEWKEHVYRHSKIITASCAHLPHITHFRSELPSRNSIDDIKIVMRPILILRLRSLDNYHERNENRLGIFEQKIVRKIYGPV